MSAKQKNALPMEFGWMREVRQITERLAKSPRWGGYPEKAYPQTTLEHSVQLQMLAIVVVKLEKQHNPKFTLDEVAILNRCLLHDVGEGLMGDMTYRFKNHPLIKQLVHHIEESSTLEMFERMPFGEILASAAQLENGSLEALFFDALERLDYVLYAAYEYFIHNNKLFLGVFHRQHSKLLKHMEIFAGVRAFYEPLVPFIEEELKQGKDYLKRMKASVPELTTQDLRILLNQLTELFQQKGISGAEDAFSQLTELVNALSE